MIKKSLEMEADGATLMIDPVPLPSAVLEFLDSKHLLLVESAEAASAAAAAVVLHARCSCLLEAVRDCYNPFLRHFYF